MSLEFDASRAAKRLALGQGVYFGVTGLWPVIHLRSFEALVLGWAAVRRGLA